MTLEGNPLSNELDTALQRALMLLSLPRHLRRPPPESTIDADAVGATAALAPEAREFVRATPRVLVSCVWLSAMHSSRLAGLLHAEQPASLELRGCTEFGDDGVAALCEGLAERSRAAPWSLRDIHLTDCGLGDRAMVSASASDVMGWSLCRLLEGPHLESCTLHRSLRSLSFAGNQLHLSGGVAERLGAALRGTKALEDLDLSSNPISDASAADLCATLLARDAAAAAGGAPVTAPPNARQATRSAFDARPAGVVTLALHFGGTQAGNMSADSCAVAIAEGAPLRALCLSGNVGDSGLRSLAEAIVTAARAAHARGQDDGGTLRELWVGDSISDEGGAALAETLRVAGGVVRLRVLALGGEHSSCAMLCYAVLCYTML